jgi:hypothetical protein
MGYEKKFELLITFIRFLGCGILIFGAITPFFAWIPDHWMVHTDNGYDDLVQANVYLNMTASFFLSMYVMMFFEKYFNNQIVMYKLSIEYQDVSKELKDANLKIDAFERANNN